MVQSTNSSQNAMLLVVCAHIYYFYPEFRILIRVFWWNLFYKAQILITNPNMSMSKKDGIKRIRKEKPVNLIGWIQMFRSGPPFFSWGSSYKWFITIASIDDIFFFTYFHWKAYYRHKGWSLFNCNFSRETLNRKNSGRNKSTL